MDGTLNDMRRLAKEQGGPGREKMPADNGRMPASAEYGSESLERIVAGIYQKLDIL